MDLGGGRRKAYVVRRSIMLDIRSSSTSRCLSLSEASSGWRFCQLWNVEERENKMIDRFNKVRFGSVFHTIALRNRTASLRTLTKPDDVSYMVVVDDLAFYACS